MPPTGVSLGHPRTIVSSGNRDAEKHAISTSLPHGPQIPELAPSIHIQGILKTQRDIHRAQEGHSQSTGRRRKHPEDTRSPSLMNQSQQSRIHSHSQNERLVHRCSGTRFLRFVKSHSISITPEPLGNFNITRLISWISSIFGPTPWKF